MRTYAGQENAHQQQMLADSLHAALTLDEMRKLVVQLGGTPEQVQAVERILADLDLAGHLGERGGGEEGPVEADVEHQHQGGEPHGEAAEQKEEQNHERDVEDGPNNPTEPPRTHHARASEPEGHDTALLV